MQGNPSMQRKASLHANNTSKQLLLTKHNLFRHYLYQVYNKFELACQHVCMDDLQYRKPRNFRGVLIFVGKHHENLYTQRNYNSSYGGLLSPTKV